MKVLLDTNVVLDLALRREPFFEDAKAIFGSADTRLKLYLSAAACTDIYYIVRKATDTQTAIAFMVDLLRACEICPLDKTMIVDALQSSFTDFEDAVQHYAALAADLDAIVTRNTRDFRHSVLPVITPANLVARLNETR